MTMEEPTIYCIKCRTHTQSLDAREEQITSKGKPRTVTKATCVVCSKRKNRFSKTIKNEVEPTIVKQPRVSKKQLQELLQKYIDNESTSMKAI